MAKKSVYNDLLIKALLTVAIFVFVIGVLYVAGKVVYSDSAQTNIPGDLLFQVPIILILISFPLIIFNFALTRLNIVKFQLKNKIIIGLSVLLMIFTTIGDVGQTYNYFTKQKETIDSKYAEIDIQYQKRFDQIPNIAKTAKSFSEFEQGIISKISDARATYYEGQSVEEKVKAANLFDSNLRGFILNVENYPNIKTDSVYIQLVQSIIQNENEIATVKKAYNNEVKVYNQFVNSFPNVIIARLMGFKEKEYLKSDLGNIIYNSKPLLDNLTK